MIPTLILVTDLSIRLLLALVILLRRTLDPPARLAWLVVVLLLPGVGAVAYLLVGKARLGRKRVRRHSEVVMRRSLECDMPPAIDPKLTHPRIEPPFQQISTLAESVAGTSPVAGNRLQLIGTTTDVIDALITDIDAARDHVHLLTYIFLLDSTGRRVSEAMIRAEQRGVECRLLVDAVGSADFLASSLPETMRRSGVQVVAALPVTPLRALFSRLDLRNHRKIAVIDGRVGYTGSHNIADASFAPKRRYAPWVDASVRIEGPVVHDLQKMFVEDWYLDTDEWLENQLMRSVEAFDGGVTAQVVGTGPNTSNYAMRQVLHAAIHLAREELILTTPYFVPDDSTLSALVTAARRGVKTDLVVPARNDSRLVAAASFGLFEILLDAGASIHEYQKGLLHAKTLTIDRDLAIVTSANLDKRSFLLNFEASLIVYDTDFASELRFLQTSYLSESRRIDPARWATRPWPKRLWHNTAGMLSPIL